MDNYIKRKRLEIIDLLQGIAMLWVIIGHHLLNFMPAIYHSIHYYIYSFHMPFFIFISSFLIAYSYKEVSYKVYISKKLHKFFFPYICIGLLITLLTGLKEGINSIPENLMFLILAPKLSASTFLWYIYMLFLLYAIYPLNRMGFQMMGTKFEILLSILGFYFYFYPIDVQLLCIDYLTKYFLFYQLGLMIVWHLNKIKKHIRLIKIIGYCSLVLFVLLSISIFIYPQAITYTTLCFCAIPAMYGLSMILSISKIIKKTLINISKNCFHIYLVHMFFIQGIALIFMWLYPFKIESIGFMTFYIICSTTFSILGSIIVFRITDRIKIKIY